MIILIKELYPHKRQPLCRCGRTGGGAIFGVKDFLHAFRRILTVADFDQGAGDDTDHVVEETSAGNTDGDNVAVAENFDSGDGADGGLYLGAGAAEAGEIVAADQIGGCFTHFVYL